MSKPSTPENYVRSHAVSDADFNAPRAIPTPLASYAKPPGLLTRTLQKVGVGNSRSSLWVPQTVAHYVPQLDHGYRSETHGIVIHVNAGWFKGTLGFVTNGLPYPYGSEGVGAHFEIGGHQSAGIYGD